MSTQPTPNQVHAAEQYKTRGNQYFSARDYDAAIKEYTAAIVEGEVGSDEEERKQQVSLYFIYVHATSRGLQLCNLFFKIVFSNQNPNISVYFTNRALCYLKLKKYDHVIADCERANKLDSNSVKGHYLLGQAFTEKLRTEEAVNALEQAYELAVKANVTYLGDIIQALLNARKKKWELSEREREKRETDLLKYLKGLINTERERQLQKVMAVKNPVAATFSKFVNNSTEVERLDAINKAHDEKLSALEQVFAQADENMGRREVPEYFLDKISFNVIHDPVITPSGITYERAHLKEHFRKIGHFDPLSRKECTERDLYPNLALKEAIEDFLKKNGWAVDY
ncbi:4802_t:CDS:10 [Paraglomus occultum]|uniref:E3 ubiquitin-protein ligase CHIP n=1 Tax=Paraglomus occultum TaxID=144539 RepID=A0A9N9F3R3_9GLOM|nr:4802_t:CDS:10 [Paraglomus occultum]